MLYLKNIAHLIRATSMIESLHVQKKTQLIIFVSNHHLVFQTWC